jgi:peroxiredoxin
VELAALQDALPEIAAAGASLVAISPELPEHAMATAEKNSLAFQVLCDRGNAVARQFGLVFQFSPELRDFYRDGLKKDLAAWNGTGTYELPIPGTFVISRDGIIRLAFVDPDYTKRLEPADVVRTLRALPRAS